MLALYSLAWWLGMPLVLARLWWRGRTEPGYRRHVAERLGFYRASAFDAYRGRVLWVHAVSVGETRAAEPLIEALLAAYPGYGVLLTHMTPTGRAAGKALFGEHAGRLFQCYLPYDTGWMTGRFLKRYAPRLGVLMETEVWPNLIAQCTRHHVPVALVNARLSERSLSKARRLSGLMRPAAAGVTRVAAQTEADAQRLRQFGVEDVEVTGSIKFDVRPPLEAQARGTVLRAQFGARPVLLCASTREGEEALILDAWQEREPDETLLVIVPRHPHRFDEVARLVAARGMEMRRRSTLGDAALPSGVNVLIGDSMGEMFVYFAACDIAFIGGSLLPLGGQNLIEACALGKPVLTGLHTFNFGAITTDAIEAGAACRVADAKEMLAQAGRLLRDHDARLSMGAKARDFAQRQRGATTRTMTLLTALIAKNRA
ncbi:MAG: 3-deoxy-D-manno-octulosonic acid transferase [Herminiimonas sp.]|nr:3-deoxy-D-manno-octulosonic acid transferase [Herminiimonas sp.]